MAFVVSTGVGDVGEPLTSGSGSGGDISSCAGDDTGEEPFSSEPTTLEELAAHCQKQLGDKALRVVGDPKAKVTRLQVGVGYATPSINNPEVDVVISGEQQETDGILDSPAYVLDAATLGIPKGWIMLGHNISEEQGMLEMADWIGSIVPEVHVQLVRSGEPFWAPR